MSGYYTQMLKKKGGLGLDLIEFRPNVLKRYEGDNGPWKLWWNVPGHMNGIMFYSWIRKGKRLEDYVALMRMSVSEGIGPAAGYILAYLKDLAWLPLSEQEHWKKYQR